MNSAMPLRSAKESDQAGLEDLVDTKIFCSPRRPPVMARTLGQRAYIEAIKAHDMTFGIGPAGTGKPIWQWQWRSRP